MNKQLNITCIIFLRKHYMCNSSLQNSIRKFTVLYIAYSEGHNGDRSSRVDREDCQVKKSPSDTCSFQGLRVSPGIGCRSLSLCVTYILFIIHSQ